MFKENKVLEKLLSFGRKIIPRPVFVFFQPYYHYCLSLVAALLYKFPARKLKVIGVTGTNGKSTVVYLISKVLEEDGFSVASLSSVEFKIKSRTWPNDLKMTLPGRFKLQSFLKQAARSKCHYAILEMTSEGVKQHRHQFINFDSIVLTNLTREHLESHGGFKNYRNAKGKLFRALKKEGKSIINLDDKNAGYFLEFKAGEKWGYGLTEVKKGIDKLVQAREYQINPDGINFKLGQTDFNINLLGKFNLYNVLAAIAAILAEDISLDDIKEGIEKVKGIPGRLEIVVKEPFRVIVDYAHTPDALEKVYQTIKESFARLPGGQAGKIIGVLGAAGGGRDKWKRPEMGKITQKYLDKIIITNEDPYDENPNQILSEIKSGISNDKIQSSNFFEILDRREAINRALRLAQSGDTVIITGKGCEPWLCVAKGKKIPWDDRRVVQEELQKINK
ncbi:MAG: UDP-N-acetylmuramoyl-L-alanyl-D-glutamate--2,6-diaminopimelate ligase [Candidatus Portnoybacteria bacterium]